MPLPILGNVVKGSLPSGQPGTAAPFSIDAYGATLVSELNARYANLVLAGIVYGVQFGSSATAAASATSVGNLALFNPANSGKNLVMLDAIITQFTIPNTAAVLATGWQSIPNQTPTSISLNGNPITNLLIGSSNQSVAKAIFAGTVVGAPTSVFRNSSSLYTDVAASAGNINPSVKDQLDGLIIIAPNSTLALVSFSSTPSVSLTLTWAEVPI